MAAPKPLVHVSTHHSETSSDSSVEAFLLQNNSQGFSGWAQTLLIGSDQACDELLKKFTPPWQELVGENLIDLCQQHTHIKLDEPLFVRRALEQKKINAKQFQSACSIWSVSHLFNTYCVSLGAPKAPPLALLALARAGIYPKTKTLGPLLNASADPLGKPALDSDVYPLLAFAFTNRQLSPEWFDALFKQTYSWYIPKEVSSTPLFRGATHLTHVAVDVLARDGNAAPLRWCAQQGATFEHKDDKGHTCVERALESMLPSKRKALLQLAELGAAFPPRLLKKVPTDIRQEIDSILLALSEQSTLSIELTLQQMRRPQQEASSTPTVRPKPRL